MTFDNKQTNLLIYHKIQGFESQESNVIASKFHSIFDQERRHKFQVETESVLPLNHDW